MCPSPKLPTSKSRENFPKLSGASARPQGELSAPPVANRSRKLPLRSKTSIKPLSSVERILRIARTEPDRQPSLQPRPESLRSRLRRDRDGETRNEYRLHQ